MAGEEFTQQYFEELQAVERNHPWTRSMRKLAHQLLPDVKRMLDVGCGAGLVLTEWPGFGIDYFSAPLRYAPKGRVGQASASALPFANGSFDLVHCADVLQHLTQPECAEALSEFSRVLEPGGRVYLRLRAPRRGKTIQWDEFTPDRVRRDLASVGIEVEFATYANCLGSLLADLTQPPREEDGDHDLKGIRWEGNNWRSRGLAAYLALERTWMGRFKGQVPYGHTLIVVGRKRGMLLVREGSE